MRPNPLAEEIHGDAIYHTNDIRHLKSEHLQGEGKIIRCSGIVLNFRICLAGHNDGLLSWAEAGDECRIDQ